SSKQEMAIIGPIVRNDLFFFVTILALVALMILFDLRRRQGIPPSTAGSGGSAARTAVESRAVRRKAQWSARKEKLWSTAVYASSFVFIVLVTAQFIYAKSTASLSPAHELTLTNGQLLVPLSEVSDGQLHRYAVHLGNNEVRFLLFKKPDGNVVSVLDACQICGPVGFYKSGNQIICKNCSAPVNPQSVGQAGGCNPIPLKSTSSAGQVVITQADLVAAIPV